ncbi:multidrug effflux MFS transporter [Clostridium magnum]|uniref:Bcr/CflA family efflux transporter n=1 Tax=Clostridium magnum DSM 2767 TaxID=1121326 RepID=A0A161VC57_9CLOT|nr:multidrug effflux MFS transporter [Clostridium magnum]KZL91501.1 bicyclomycin resistance protein [Clostridium magnum DSM 2767]SHH44977.1 MFS transporter, DHA1 family, bicyclomycin/chloramphenicol resistance protein [Clostridium magnum DSM 2767]
MNITECKSTESGNNQKYLGNKGLIAFIALMNAFIPLSTDLYLPALPTMSSYFASNSAITNLTLSSFFVCYAVGILLWGPLSDKYGRKPILTVGAIIYIISSVSCALSTDVYFLILSRAMQGIGAGGITSVSVAIIKDCFSGKKRESILAITQSISGLAPMIAPIIGALILKFSDWRGAFWALTVVSVINLLLTILYRETLKEEERYTGTIIGSIGRLFTVSKNKSFFIPTVIFSLNALPFMGYIAISSYIYVDYFRLSEQSYSYFFAANALISILGPVIYVKFLSNINKKAFPIGCFALSVFSGLLVMSVGTLSPVIFLMSFIIMSVTGSAIRPFSTNVLFEQQKGDTGSASSLINTLFTILGSIGMSIASMPWGNMVEGLGIIITIFSCLSLIGWYLFMKSSIPCIGVKRVEYPLTEK